MLPRTQPYGTDSILLTICARILIYEHLFIHSDMNTLNTKTLQKGVFAAKILSSKARFKILDLIMQKKGKDICVKEIAKEVGLTHSATSHQLAKLQSEGIVRPSRKGQMMCYHLSNSAMTKQLAAIIEDIKNT